MGNIKRFLIAVGLVLLIAGAVLLVLRRHGPSKPGRASDYTYISLATLPNVSTDVLAANGGIIKVQEPILYNTRTKTARFIVTILSTKNFGDVKYLTFGGNSTTLQNFVNEIRYVNSASCTRLPGQAIRGTGDAIAGIATGIWQLVRHPVNTATGIGSAVKNATDYAKRWKRDEVSLKKDIKEVVAAYYLSVCCQIAHTHSLDYLDLKTEPARVCIHHEADARVGARTTSEVAILLLPFLGTELEATDAASDAGKVGEAADAASDAAKAGEAADIARATEAATTAENLTELGEDAESTSTLLKYRGLFKDVAPDVESTVERLKDAGRTRLLDSSLESEIDETVPQIEKNRLAGQAREVAVASELETHFPVNGGFHIEPQCPLRSETGSVVFDPVSGESRRLDFVVMKDGQCMKSIEVTSPNADKVFQLAKEARIREAGGNFVRDRASGELVPFKSDVQTEVWRRP